MDKQSKHTPGPWVLETVKTSSGICHKVGPFPSRRNDEKPRHACLYADYPSEYAKADQELLANARLIAAAPELLAALIDAISLLDSIAATLPDKAIGRSSVNVAASARAAIAKAEGVK